MKKKYITIRLDEKTKDLVNQSANQIGKKEYNKSNQRLENSEIKENLIEAIQTYIYNYRSAGILDAESSAIRGLLSEKITQLMDKKIELLELIMKDYLFIREDIEDD